MFLTSIDPERISVMVVLDQGTTLEDFRKDFDRIVTQHGWSYKGSRNWRSEVIYSTNIRASYAAGRWEQLTDPEQMQVMPYLTYKHGDSRVPRLEHLAWDGLTLPADDPWWKAHYPPNGWGCKCRVYGSTLREYQAAREAGLGKAPSSPIDPATGEPAGIDKGWGYNVGEAAECEGYRVLTDKFETLQGDLSRKWLASYVNEPAFERFIAGGIKGEFPVAVLDEASRQQIGAKTQTVWMSAETTAKNKSSHDDLVIADYQQLPHVVADAQTVIRDGDNTMVFIRMRGKIYHAVVKTTKSGQRDYVTSYRLTDMADVERMKRKGTVIKDEL